MILSLRFLQDVGGVNNFQWANDLRIGAASPTTLYLQLIDASVFPEIKGYNPSGRRYMPAVGAILTVTFGDINDNQKISRFASQPFAQDPSIWMVPILATDFLSMATIEVGLSLNESGTITTGCACGILRVIGCSNNGCR